MQKARSYSGKWLEVADALLTAVPAKRKLSPPRARVTTTFLCQLDRVKDARRTGNIISGCVCEGVWRR